MDALLVFLDVFSIMCWIGLIVVILFLLKKVGDYVAKVDYLESILSQTTNLATKNEAEIENITRKSAKKN